MKSRGKLSVMLITPLTDNHCQIFAMCVRSMCPLSMLGGLTLWNTVELAHLIPFGIHDSGSVRLLKLQIGTNQADDVTGNSNYVYITQLKEIMFYKFKKLLQLFCNQEQSVMSHDSSIQRQRINVFLPHFNCNHKHMRETEQKCVFQYIAVSHNVI